MKRIITIFWLMGLMMLLCFDTRADWWQDLNPTTRPGARCGHSMVELNGNLYVFGGLLPSTPGGIFNDLWKFSEERWVMMEPPVSHLPPKRFDHAAAVSGGKMYIFFGADERNILGDIWSYSPADNTWNQEPSTGAQQPASRYGHSAVALQDGRILLFGGSGAGGRIRDNCAWIYTPGPGSWEKVGIDSTPSLSWHSADMIGTDMYVFGGYGTTGYNSDVSVYTPFQDTWANIVPPAEGARPRARLNHASASIGPRMFVFGGTADGSELSDVWEFNTITNKWTQSAGFPIPLTRAKAAALSSSIIVFGGQSGGVAIDWTLRYTPDENPCAATLWSDLRMHVPALTFARQYYWANFQYTQGVDMDVANAGLVDDPGYYSTCAPSTLSSDLILYVPEFVFNHVSYWLTFQYLQDGTFRLIEAGQY
jgi:N-acetylneuraminic acid mutarotase